MNQSTEFSALSKEESSAPSQPSQHEGEGAAQRQLELRERPVHSQSFTIWRRLSIKNISTIIPDAPAGRTLTSRWVNAIANLGRASGARANLQKVLNDYADSEFAGPAAYALAEMAVRGQRLCRCRFRSFHRSVGKSKEQQ